MSDAHRDQNHVTTAEGISSVDSTTPQLLRVDPSTNRVLVSIAATPPASVTALTAVKRDQNFRPTVYGISSVDGTTLVPIRTDTDGNLLVDIVIE